MRLLGQFQTFYFYFLHGKTLYAQKAQKEIQGTKRHKKHKNAKKQKHKTQISEQKLKMRLKNI